VTVFERTSINTVLGEKMVLFLSLLTAVLLTFLIAAGRLTVFLHIGPHKTGSTHLQSYLVHQRNELEKDHVCLPFQNRNAKDFSVISREVRSNNSRADHFLNMRKCLEKGTNVVISAEDLAGLSLRDIRTFKSLIYTVATGIDIEVKVILYYREWLNYIYSRYSEVAKVNQRGTVSFPEYFMGNGDTTGKPNDFSYTVAVRNYNATFGEKNMIIVDYYGVEAANKDIAYVFVCEILQAMCSQSALLNTVEKKRENTKPNEVFLHYLSLFKFYMHAHSVQFCTRDYQTNAAYIADLEKRKIRLPTTSAQLRVFRRSAIDLDAKFHAKHGHLMLYNNQKANLKKIDDFQFEEVDMDQFSGNVTWQSFMKQEMQTFLHNGKLCSLASGSKVIRDLAELG
jgi:hypothetical protein